MWSWDSNRLAASTLAVAAHRPRLCRGFALCCAALAVALATSFGLAVTLLATSSDPPSDGLGRLTERIEPVLLAVRIAVDLLLATGVVVLYRVPSRGRWRLAGGALLALAGMDLTTGVFQFLVADDGAREFIGSIGDILSWLELWMIAVLAADAAEAIERPDITYQTETAGRLVVWGAFSWVAWTIWSFGPPAPDGSLGSDAPGVVAGTASIVLMLFVLFRSTYFCAELTVAFSRSASD